MAKEMGFGIKNGLVVETNGTQKWYLNNIIHREKKPAIIHKDGYREWLINGKRHRKGEPAVIHRDGYKEWFRDGRRHREEGPAIVHPNGYKAWYLNGIELNPKQIRILKKINCCSLIELSPYVNDLLFAKIVNRKIKKGIAKGLKHQLKK